MAVRIRARAVRHCGELLKQFDAKGKRTDRREPADADVSKLSQKEAAGKSGISERQEVTADRLANISEQSFNDQVESETPPTITHLAKQGVKPINKEPVIDLMGRAPGEVSVSARAGSLFVVGGVQFLGWYRGRRGLAQPHARPAAVLGDELDASGFEGGADCGEIVGRGYTSPLLKIADRAFA
jgi:hypothetical protein